MADILTTSARPALALIVWLGCALIIGEAYQQLPVLVRAGDTLVMHAHFEEVLARQEVRDDG